MKAGESGIAKAAGADLYFERRGAGPPLLLIAGGGGDCGAYRALADDLASDYTVLTYDRRGNSRSPLHYEPVEISMARAERGRARRAAGLRLRIRADLR
jgi:pimeloyl-ACP methyl ester carboxylesterase